MKEFACGELVPDCTARFTATTEDEILLAVAEHARRHHDAEPIPELAAAVRAAVVTAT